MHLELYKVGKRSVGSGSTGDRSSADSALQRQEVVSGCHSIRPCRSPSSPGGDQGLRQRGSWEHWPGWMHREHLAGWGLQALEPLLCCPVLFQIQVAEAVHSPSSPGSETTSCQQFFSPSPTGFHFCAFRPAPPHSKLCSPTFTP